MFNAAFMLLTDSVQMLAPESMIGVAFESAQKQGDYFCQDGLVFEYAMRQIRFAHCSVLPQEASHVSRHGCWQPQHHRENA